MRIDHSRPVQAALLYLALTHGFPGLWALFRPRDFYDSFPGFGRAWVAADGPYNEHLIRDVGAFFLALSVLCLLALLTPRQVTVRTTATCLLVFNGPHWWYHLHHLHGLPYSDRIENMVALSVAVLLPVWLLLRESFFPKRRVSLQHENNPSHE